MRLAVLTAICLLPLSAVAEPEKGSLPAQMKGLGVKQCMPAVNSLAKFVTEDLPHGSNVTYDPKLRDKDPVYAVTEINAVDDMKLSFMSFVPLAGNRCATTYLNAIYRPQSCLSVSRQFSDFHYVGELKTKVALLTKGTISTYLMPAGEGCMIFKQEVVPDGNAP